MQILGIEVKQIIIGIILICFGLEGGLLFGIHEVCKEKDKTINAWSQPHQKVDQPSIPKNLPLIKI